MKKLLLLLTTLTLSFLTSGCAAMFSGSRNEVTFLSDTPGLRVQVGDTGGETPATLDISKKAKEATVSLPDGSTQTIQLESSLMVHYVVMDVLFTPGFGLSGLLVDGLTSAWREHPDVIQLELNEDGQVAVSTPSIAQSTP